MQAAVLCTAPPGRVSASLTTLLVTNQAHLLRCADHTSEREAFFVNSISTFVAQFPRVTLVAVLSGYLCQTMETNGNIWLAGYMHRRPSLTFAVALTQLSEFSAYKDACQQYQKICKTNFAQNMHCTMSVNGMSDLLSAEEQIGIRCNYWVLFRSKNEKGLDLGL